MPSRKDSPNRNTRFLTNRLKAMYGEDFEPIVKAAECAVRMQQMANEAEGTEEEFDMRKDCVAAWERIGQYCSPKLKAVEIVDENGDNALPKLITVNVVDPRNINP